MNDYRFYTTLYGYTRNYHGVPYWMLTPARRIIRHFASKRLPSYFERHPADINRKRNENVIVSLTSFPARIGFVHLTIESLLRQTVLPNHIFLWLSKEQFPSENTIPANLKDLQNDIFQIRLVDGDIRSHKKYYYAMSEYPDSIVITTDDDIIYPPNIIKTLLTTSDKYPSCIIANVARTISYNGCYPEEYSHWRIAKALSRTNNVQIGAGCVLYPSHSLYKDCLDLELSQRLAPTVDDLWLNAMARLQGTDVIKTTFKQALLPVIIPKDEKLTTINVQGNRNDEQLKSIREYYSQTELGDPYQLSNNEIGESC